MSKRRRKPEEIEENFVTRYRAKIQQVGFAFNIELSQQLREVYKDTTTMSKRAKELLLEDMRRILKEKEEIEQKEEEA